MGDKSEDSGSNDLQSRRMPQDIVSNVEKNLSSTSPLHGNGGRLQMKTCNIYDGRWVYDEKARPIYEPWQCPYHIPQVSCQRNGRPDHDYEKWRWEANDCEIPRFNATDFLERFRGKKVIIVGDSISRNQWQSLSCLLYSVIPRGRAEIDLQGGRFNHFRAKDYDCIVRFFWSPFFIQQDPKTRPEMGNILVLDKITGTKRWRGADIMVFNTGPWWTHIGKKQQWKRLQYKGKLVDMEIERAFEIAMKTWGDWIDENVDPAKTTVYFRSTSPEHLGNENRNHWCYNHTQPINNEPFYLEFPMAFTEIIERSISKMKTPVQYLNITKLSEYRRDAHPSVYLKKQGKVLDPRVAPDCSHWCLPGVPDTWNQLLYTSLVHRTSPEVL